MEPSLFTQESKAQTFLEKAELLTQLGEFQKAIPLFESAKTLFLADSNTENYLKCQNRLIRLCAETDQLDKITHLKEELQDLALKQGLQLSSRTYYTLGVIAAYRMQLDNALEYAQKSLALSLESQNKEDTCYAISLSAGVLRLMGRFQDALREIYNLKVFFDVITLPEVQASSILLNGQLLMDLQRYDEAIQVLWQGDDILKVHKSAMLPIQLMGLMAQAHRRLGQNELALSYLRLARRLADPENMPRLCRQIDLELKELEEEQGHEFDLIFNENTHEVTERKIGRIDFRNQFVLLDLLRLFVTHPGKTFSKEYLVEHIWNEKYDPAVHDNKVYVTIKRLRRMIEPDLEKPKYIFRAKNGYFMSKDAKIRMEKNLSGSV